MSAFVTDASFAAAWCFEDEATPLIREWLVRAGEHGIIVPDLWKYEVGNLLCMAERQERITSDNVRLSLSLLQDLVIEEYASSLPETWKDTLALAQQFRLTVYDASYAQLALRRRLVLATNDKLLVQVASALGVETISG